MVDLREPGIPPAIRGNMWPNEALAVAHRRLGLRGSAADTYLTVRLVADRTRWVSSTIYYPFILIVLMLGASASGFDSWPRSWQVMLAIAMPALIAILAARSLQTCARRSRDRLIERLGREIGRTISPSALSTFSVERESDCIVNVPAASVPNRDASTPPSSGVALAVETMTATSTVESKPIPAILTLDDVKLSTTLTTGIRHGALAPYTDNPVLRVVLLPFGGFGAIQIIDYAISFM